MGTRPKRFVLKKISPSKYNYIDSCQLRYLLDNNNYKSRDRYSFNVNNFLGTLIHRFLESYFKEKWSLIDFENQWSKVLGLSLKKYKIDEDDVALIQYHVPFYIIKKNKIKQLLKSFKRLPNSEAIPEYRIETELIKGEIDFYEFSKEKIRVTDYKTGPIYEFLDYEIRTVKKSYIDQLKTYGLAILQECEKNNLNINPEAIELVLLGLNKDENYKCTFSRKEYEEHELSLQKIIASINNYNTNYSLASPNQNTCKYCEYDKECKPLHDKLISSIEIWDTRIVLTELNIEFNDNIHQINIMTNGGHQSIHRIPLEHYNELKLNLSQGYQIFIKGLFRMTGTRVKKWTKFTEYEVIK